MQTSHSDGSVNIFLVSKARLTLDINTQMVRLTLKAWPRLAGISLLVVMVASVRSATVCITPAAFNGNLVPSKVQFRVYNKPSVLTKKNQQLTFRGQFLLKA